MIQREFERLYDPNHPVRNHLETLDSVEEVHIIRKAMKKQTTDEPSAVKPQLNLEY